MIEVVTHKTHRSFYHHVEWLFKDSVIFYGLAASLTIVILRGD